MTVVSVAPSPLLEVPPAQAQPQDGPAIAPRIDAIGQETGLIEEQRGGQVIAADPGMGLTAAVLMEGLLQEMPEQKAADAPATALRMHHQVLDERGPSGLRVPQRRQGHHAPPLGTDGHLPAPGQGRLQPVGIRGIGGSRKGPVQFPGMGQQAGNLPAVPLAQGADLASPPPRVGESVPGGRRGTCRGPAPGCGMGILPVTLTYQAHLLPLRGCTGDIGWPHPTPQRPPWIAGQRKAMARTRRRGYTDPASQPPGAMHPLPEAVERAYGQCLQQARSHYENFPVASRLLPPRLRRPVAAIYSFARRGDDLADEGGAPAEDRLRALDDLGRKLDAAAAGDPNEDATFIALAHAMAVHHLPAQPFHDLLQAFRRDITQKRYEDFADLESYCRCSANPVGRLLLHLCDRADPERIARSDAVCTALQLINFYQDLAQDFHELGRIYIPREEMRAFGVDEDHFRHRITDDAFRALMHHQFQRAGERLHQGAPLGGMLPGRIGLEIRLIIAAGGRVLTRLRRQETDLFSRPRLRGADYGVILLHALAGRA